jgi:lipoprotein-anchoring transpeptidase ErfK/SrfK
MVRIGLKGSLLFILFTYTAVYGVEKEIIVDLSEQRAYAYEDGYLVLEGRISSGVIGRETPNGAFRILEKKRYHRSNLWPKPNGGAKMNYMLRLTNTGIAMHLGPVPKRPASHGCIRMKNGFAQKMFRWAEVGTPVYVEGSAREYLYYHQPASTEGGWHYEDAYGIIDFHD